MRAEARQASAMSTVSKATLAKDTVIKKSNAEIANLTQEVKFLLSLPPTARTIPVANELLDASLKLSGAPSQHESALEAEVQDLLASNDKNEKTIVRINGTVNQLLKDKEDADKNIANSQAKLSTATVTLYQDALRIAADDDSKATILHLMIGVVVFVVAMILLRIFFTMTTTGATLAAKLP